MFLKEIELQGFKSFADKTRVNFETGVTAIVGPNGSGKSNITESLRWALGESSAKSLRGGKMPDVIFAGTEHRKALNYAQVTVLLDNSDGFIKEQSEEIRVERHIYRNGDSDYLLNGKKVRLKDIHDLFMDTGLGRDSFSIISQGKVEDIFKSKPEERRMIFEEAAGVLKYKTRKKETQSRLSQTQDNLDRLEDIIYELDGQVLPLRKQADVAKKFLDLDNQRQKLHLDVLIYDINEQKLELHEGENALAEVKQNLSHYFTFKENSELKNQKLKQSRHAISDKIEQKQSDIIELNRLISNYQHQLEVNRLENSQNQEKASTVLKNIQNIKQDCEDLTNKISIENEEKHQLTLKQHELKKEIEILKQEQAEVSENPDSLVEKKRESFVELLQKEAQLSNELTLVLADIDSQEQASQEFSQEIEQLKTFLIELDEKKDNSQKLLDEKSDFVSILREKYLAKQHTLTEKEELYRKKQTDYFDQLDQIKSKEARKNSLESILKNHSQFYSGVKAVLQSANQIGGIIGAVSEQMTFDRQFQIAIEIALGASSQHIIVKDEFTAKQAISFLKKNKQGRATFLPLTTIKPRFVQEKYRDTLVSSHGFIGIASELVSYPTELSHIFENLLGTIVLFDTIENANIAAKKVNFQVRIVTLDGSEIRPGGSFAGGAVRQNNTTFIKPELDELTRELGDLFKVNHDLERTLSNDYEKIEALKQNLEELKAKGETARLEEQKVQLSFEQDLEKWKSVTQQLNLLQGHSLEKTSDDLLQQKVELEENLTKIAKEKVVLESEIKSLKENKDSFTMKVAKLSEKLSFLQLEERDVVNQIKFLNERINTETQQLKKYQQNLKVLESEKADLDNFKMSFNRGKLQNELSEVEKRKSEDESELIRLKFELEDHEAQLEDLAELFQKEAQKNEDYIRQQAQIEAKNQSLKDKLRQAAFDLSENYQLSFEEACEKANTVLDIHQSREQLKELTRKIKHLGPINIDAIEQFEEVNQRLQFLVQQKSDLDKAKELLVTTINDMDTEVKQQFKATFEAIRDSFKVTFRQMFGGGNADLVLTDGDLLTSGIDIAVQPPGKKIQSLNLMSGGEKSLTALALLFAIIRVKTVPFVIFDEVEAALDEANVKRFGDYLNRFDQSSQFIVVTHRRGTMAAADSIYGVTMQESGVSNILSVKLKEAEKLIP